MPKKLTLPWEEYPEKEIIDDEKCNRQTKQKLKNTFTLGIHIYTIYHI